MAICRAMTQPETPAATVRAIVAYKTVKAALQLSVGLLLLVCLPFGLPAELHTLALSLREHTTHAWASSIAALLDRGSTQHGILFVCLALGLDGSLTAVEAWALRAGHWWGPWLVVVASGLLLPFEVYAIARSAQASRVLLLVLNLAIVLYLAQHATRARRAAGG
jgi:uncharacterized membrane protein (DUF2068 family)